MDIKQIVLSNQNLEHSIEEFAIKKKIPFNKNLLETIRTDDKKLIDSSIKNAPYGTHIFIDNISTLGHSSFYILKRIQELKNKNITLCILNKQLIFHLGNELLFKVLETLLEFEITKIKHRTEASKNTRDKKGTKLGRKEGQPIKSKYDKHKRRIMHLHKQGVPNTKIVKDIKMGTPQSLGKYIKQVKLEEKVKKQKKGAYLLKEDDLKNINNFNN